MHNAWRVAITAGCIGSIAAASTLGDVELLLVLEFAFPLTGEMGVSIGLSLSTISSNRLIAATFFKSSSSIMLSWSSSSADEDRTPFSRIETSSSFPDRCSSCLPLSLEFKTS